MVLRVFLIDLIRMEMQSRINLTRRIQVTGPPSCSIKDLARCHLLGLVWKIMATPETKKGKAPTDGEIRYL